MFLVFQENSKKVKIMAFLGCCNWKTHISHKLILVTITEQYISKLLYKKYMCLPFSSHDFTSASSQNGSRLFHHGEPPFGAPCVLYLQQDILHVKRPRLSENQKNEQKPLVRWGTPAAPRQPM